MLAAAATSPLLWSEPLTLEEACRLSLLTQPRVQVMDARLERSQASERESWTPWNPRLSLDGNYSYTTPNAVLNQGGQNIVFSQNNNYLVTLRLTQLLWNGGLYANQAQARKWQVVIQQERGRETRLLLEEEAGLAFLQAKSAAENVRLSQHQVAQRQAQLAQSRQLFEKGTVPRYDLLRGEAEVARADQELIESQRVLQLRRSALSSLLQRPVEELADLPQPEPPEPAQGWEAALKRPDLQIAALALKESEARLQAARSENAPSLSLQSDVQSRNATVAFPGTQWNTGLVFSWPLYDQGQSKARAEQVEAELKELEAQAREVERLARLEVEQLQAEVVTRYSAWLTSRTQSLAAEEAERVAELRYENGLATQVERLEAELNSTRALRDQINARYDLAMARCRLRRAMGLPQFEGVKGDQDANT